MTRNDKILLNALFMLVIGLLVAFVMGYFGHAS